MYVACVTVFVKPGFDASFISETEKNHRNTRQEPGNLRFDVLRGEDDPNRFFLYEVYVDKEAFTAHQKTPHYLAWREAVADAMAQPRQGVKYQSLFPSNEAGRWNSNS